MTSLIETLPVLDEAVPALPGKIESVAKMGDEFHQAAQAAIGAFRQKRADAEALVEQVRQALESLREQATEQEQHLTTLSGALEQAVEEEAAGIRDGADELHGAGEQAVAAFDQLEADLVQAGDRVEGAQEDARSAVDAVAAEAGTSEQELEAATGAMVAAVGATRQAIEDGQELISQGVTTLKDAMLRLLGDAQERLGQTYQRLDEVRAQQEKAVGEATSTLDAERRQLQQELQQRVEQDLQQALDPELEAAAAALAEMGQEVLTLQSATESERDGLVERLTAVADRIPPLQGGAEQVKRAADQVGIAWP
jgi:hypothetical protein